MLSRVADALFWMSRYLERAEQVARLLDVCSQLDLDLQGVVADSHDMHWQAVAEVMPYGTATVDGVLSSTAVTAALTFDAENSFSIVSCVKRARNNARSIRGSISSDMWRELNKLYWLLNDPDFRIRTQDSPHDLYAAVELGAQVFQGVCDATLPRDEGWHFIQLGKYLERADKTLRLLDVKVQQLSHPIEPSVLNLHWGSVLKSSLAFQAYQRMYTNRVEPDRVIEFLLLSPEFPHAVCFCLQAALEALQAVSGGAQTQQAKAGRLLGRAVSDLVFAEADSVEPETIKPLLDATLQRCVQAGGAVQEQYFLI
jgi:uncharacterized alpha-E superfamily protein